MQEFRVTVRINEDETWQKIIKAASIDKAIELFRDHLVTILGDNCNDSFDDVKKYVNDLPIQAVPK